jgi:hypothetical protein
VPKAAVDEDRDAESAERDVRDPAGLGQDGNMDAVANTARMQLAAQGSLGRRVLLPNALHAAARFRR